MCDLWNVKKGLIKITQSWDREKIWVPVRSPTMAICDRCHIWTRGGHGFDSCMGFFFVLHSCHVDLILSGSGNSGWRATSWKCHCQFCYYYSWSVHYSHFTTELNYPPSLFTKCVTCYSKKWGFAHMHNLSPIQPCSAISHCSAPPHAPLVSPLSLLHVSSTCTHGLAEACCITTCGM